MNIFKIGANVIRPKNCIISQRKTVIFVNFINFETPNFLFVFKMENVIALGISEKFIVSS